MNLTLSISLIYDVISLLLNEQCCIFPLHLYISHSILCWITALVDGLRYNSNNACILFTTFGLSSSTVSHYHTDIAHIIDGNYLRASFAFEYSMKMHYFLLRRFGCVYLIRWTMKSDQTKRTKKKKKRTETKHSKIENHSFFLFYALQPTRINYLRSILLEFCLIHATIREMFCEREI